MEQPRGIRNHNPLNIKRNEIQWVGLAAHQLDPVYCTFQAPEYGIRAAARILATYQERHGICTLREVVTRWAPPHENETAAYLMAVSIWSKIAPDDVIDLTSFDIVFPLSRAMTRMENGNNDNQKLPAWYPDALYERGLRLAGVTRRKPLTQSRTMRGTVTAAASGAVAGSTLLAQMLGLSPDVAAVLPDALDGLSAQHVAWLTIGVSVAGSLYAAWSRRDDFREGRL